MFDVSRRIFPYPQRSILEDVLMRSCEDGVDGSMFGLRGCRELLREQFRGKNEQYAVEDIISSAADFNADKMHPVDWSEDVANLGVTERPAEYYRRLEDIDERWVHKYVENVLIGFKLHRDGVTKLRQESYEVGYVTDLETGESMIATDLELEESAYSHIERDAAVLKLPYLLRMLQQGSIKARIHLLSMVIAREKLLKTSSRESYSAIDFVRAGVYRMGMDGTIGRMCVSTDNNDTNNEFQGLRYAMKWVSGVFPEDVYYKAANELVYVTQVLGIDLAEENPLDYSQTVVEGALCQYLASNKEFIEAKGYGDPKVRKLLETENLFTVVRSVSEVDDETDRPLSRVELTEVLADCVNDQYVRNSAGKEVNSEWGVLRPKVVAEFLETISNGKYNIASYSQENTLLWSEQKGRYAGYPVRDVVRDARYAGRLGYFSLTGNFVIQNNVLDEGYIVYISMEEYLAKRKTGEEVHIRYVEV